MRERCCWNCTTLTGSPMLHWSAHVEAQLFASWSFDEGTWIQQITVWDVEPEALNRELAGASLRRAGTVDGDPCWVIAVPVV